MNIEQVILILKKEIKKFNQPIIGQKEFSKTPFRVLISCILSLRTKDEVTADASRRLFAIADTPKLLSSTPITKIEELIYPVGFYKRKALQIKQISTELYTKHKSIVPDTISELIKFKGVGRKTANIVITEGYKKPGIAVDTHVHRISNRLGYVNTKNPDETEFALRKKLPEKYWILYNNVLVTWGQNICKPVSPLCSICRIKQHCKQVDVKKSR